MATAKEATPEEPAESEVRIGEVLNIGEFDDFSAVSGPLQPTVVDPSGVERIVGPAVDTRWKPAPTAASDEEIARHEAFEARMEELRTDRLGATQVSADRTGGGEKVAKAALEAERPAKAK